MTSSIDDRTPVLVGVGQFKQRPDDPVEALEPIAMMQTALERAADDAGSRQLLSGADQIWVVKGAWPYGDPGALLAERFGATARTGMSGDGGNSPQSLVNEACRRVASGAAGTVLIAGAEGIWSRRRARRAGGRIPYTEQAETGPDERITGDVSMNNEVERERGFEAPVVMYPIFESAFRASRGETIDDHRDRVSALWEGFNRVAVDNEYAWLRSPMTAAEIRSTDGGNRMVGFPYTRAMNSNWDLDLAAGLIVCAAGTARALGISTDRWVFPHAGTDGADTIHVSNRQNLHSSPAIRTAGRRAFELAGVGPDDLAHVDLYSCFPSAVQISATELGLSFERQLTVTGGLTFAGGPLNNYVTHGIASMADVLRDDPGSIGLCTANGGYITKHAFGIYSTNPPAEGFRSEHCQAAIDEHPTTEFAPDFIGRGELEAYTVMHDGDGPQRAFAAVRTPSGARQWATSGDAGLMSDLMSSERIGSPVDVTPEFSLELG